MRHSAYYIICALALTANSGWAREDGVRETVAYLSSLGSRVSGYPGAAKAADYVEKRLREIGLAGVQREPFEVTVPIDRGGELLLTESGERYGLYSLWPNLVRTSTLPEYAGEMIYGGDGEWKEYAGRELDGRVVLLEFNSWSRWLQAASLGVRAIVFIAPEETTRNQAAAKYSTAPLDIPRFWIEREAGLRLKERLLQQPTSVVLKGRMDWQRETAWNIWGRFPGTDPALADETIVIETYYDGMSVVPALAPAAEATSGIAALLELAEHLVRYPPRRPVVLVATGRISKRSRGLFTSSSATPAAIPTMPNGWQSRSSPSSSSALI